MLDLATMALVLQDYIDKIRLLSKFTTANIEIAAELTAENANTVKYT